MLKKSSSLCISPHHLSLCFSLSDTQCPIVESAGIQLPCLYGACTKDNAKILGFPNLYAYYILLKIDR